MGVNLDRAREYAKLAGLSDTTPDDCLSDPCFIPTVLSCIDFGLSESEAMANYLAKRKKTCGAKECSGSFDHWDVPHDWVRVERHGDTFYFCFKHGVELFANVDLKEPTP